MMEQRQIDWEVREVELEGIQQHQLVLPDERDPLSASVNGDLGHKPDASLSHQLQQSLELNK